MLRMPLHFSITDYRYAGFDSAQPAWIPRYLSVVEGSVVETNSTI